MTKEEVIQEYKNYLDMLGVEYLYTHEKYHCIYVRIPIAGNTISNITVTDETMNPEGDCLIGAAWSMASLTIAEKVAQILVKSYPDYFYDIFDRDTGADLYISKDINFTTPEELHRQVFALIRLLLHEMALDMVVTKQCSKRASDNHVSTYERDVP